MGKIFDTLINISNIAELINTLDSSFQSVEEFFYASYSQQEEQRDSFERFILFKHSLLNELDYREIKNRSFILMLLDLSERHGVYSCIPHLVNIIQANDICINSRMEAGLKFTYPEPKTNEELVEKLTEICNLLETAYQHEDDSEKAIQITLLNFFDHVFYNTNPTYSQQLISDYLGIKQTLSFVEGLEFLNKLNTYNGLNTHNEIQTFIANLYNIERFNQDYSEKDFLIEKDTEYSNYIQSIPANFKSIRQYCIMHSNGNLRGRGVLMLSSEEEMFEYIKRFGRMHYAKLETAFSEPFPQQFGNNVDIIDWGCGQALATMAFIEKYGNTCVDNITLIEPSEIVLKRASLHCHRFAPNAKIRTINKKLDELKINDIRISKSNCTIHLFSNILDIDDYQPRLLMSLVGAICLPNNYFVCVSPYIDDVKTIRITSFCNYFKDRKSFTLFHDILSTKYSGFWMCNNSYRKAFLGHGNYDNCNFYDENGCQNKWTRVIKVFSI